MSIIDARIVKQLPAVNASPAFRLDAHLLAGSGITVLMGASGSGKTMLLNCLAGFARPDQGRILVRDQIYFDAESKVNLRPEKRNCGYIFQDHALFPHMTVRQNLRFAASLPHSGTTRLNLRRRITELLEHFELTALANRKPSQLSGGQNQRAALARVLVRSPSVLLLDEPTRGLDVALRQSFYRLLRSLSQTLETPILLISHDASECLELADRVAVLAKGSILQAGTRADVFLKPASTQIAHLLDIYNVVPAEILALNPSTRSSRLRILNQEIDGPNLPGHLIGDRGFACVRRSELRLAASESRPTPQQIRLDVQEAFPSPHGVRLDFAGEFSMTISEAEYQSLEDKTRLTLEIPASAIAFADK
jgi:molybdate transport system ATP-binding protein